MKPTNRALRVGVLLGGKLVEERTFRSATPITIGQSLRCTLNVPADGVPTEHVLFAVDQGRLVLRVTENMTGRLVHGDTEVELRPGTIAVQPGARGRIHIGDATILFQELAAAPIAPRPQLPASVRGTLADRVDRRLAVIIAGSLLLHLGIAGWAWMTDRDHDRSADDNIAQYDPPTYDVTSVDVPDEPVTHGEPGVAAPARPAIQTPSTTRTRPDRLPDPIDADRWASVLTGNQPGRDGPNEIANRMPDTALDRQIRQIRDGNQNVIGGNRTSRDRDLRIGDGPDGPSIGDPGLDHIAKEERKPITRIAPVPMPRPPGKGPSLTMEMVLAHIQGAYMPGLQRCYVKYGLANDPSLVARVTISFTVDDTGASTENRAHGATSEVDGCIQDQMGAWKFPVPKDEDGDRTDAPFRLQLALQPS